MNTLKRSSLMLCSCLAFSTCGPKPGPEPGPRRADPRDPVARRAPPDRRATPPRRPGKEAWRAKPPRPGAPPAIVTPRVETHRLKNGLTVLLVKRAALPLCHLHLAVRAGSYEDPTAKPGVASLTADMLNEGVRGLSALQLSERAGQIGGSISTWADEDGSHLRIGVLRRHLGAATALLARVALKPTFPKKELQRRKSLTVNHIRRWLHRPRVQAEVVFRRSLFGADHPYGRLDSGRPQQIVKITRKDVQRFYKRYYTPRNAALVVVGDVTWPGVQPLVRKHFGRWRGRAVKPAPVQTAKPMSGRLIVVDRPGAAQSVLRVGHHGPARKHPDMVKLLVMNMVLGGSFSSRINMNLRERHGYTYGAHSSFALGRRPSPFKVGTAVQTRFTAPALKEIMKELQAMSTGRITPLELRAAKQFLSISVSGWFVTNGGVAGSVARLFLYQLPYDFWTQFPARVKGVDRAGVAQVAKRHLQADYKVIVVGDLRRIGPSLKRLGLGEATVVKP